MRQAKWASPGSDSHGRSPWQIARSVWFALFMREAIARTMANRMGWFWMIAEPAAIVLIFVWIRAFIRGGRLIINAEFIPWLVVGLIGFFMVRDALLRGMGAVDANRALFAYRQVLPVDPVLVRITLEGMLRTIILLLFIGGAWMLDINIIPDYALGAMVWWLSLWFLGLALGLITSVAGTLVPEIATVVRMLSWPLLILSGVIIPLHNFPRWILEYLMYNPIVHGLELLRAAFFHGYVVVPGTSAHYFWMFTLTAATLGLLLHLRFQSKLKVQ